MNKKSLYVITFSLIAVLLGIVFINNNKSVPFRILEAQEINEMGLDKVTNELSYGYGYKYISHNNKKIVFIRIITSCEFIDINRALIKDNGLYIKGKIKSIINCGPAQGPVEKYIEVNNVFNEKKINVKLDKIDLEELKPGNENEPLRPRGTGEPVVW